VPYIDVAISTQTRRPRVTFEENSGLTEVHPVDFIEETIDTDPMRPWDKVDEGTAEDEAPDMLDGS
jgi:hypothetical protein